MGGGVPHVNISKGAGRGFGDVTNGELDRYVADVNRLVTSTDWAQLERKDFLAHGATVFAYVNQAHPFREGNGRTSKVFMQHVAEQSRFAFDYARVTPEVWNQSSALSGPDLYSYAPDPTSLVPVFDAITVERRTAPPTTERTEGLEAVRRAQSGLAALGSRSDVTRDTPPAGGPSSRGRGPYLPGARYGPDRGEGR